MVATARALKIEILLFVLGDAFLAWASFRDQISWHKITYGVFIVELAGSVEFQVYKSAISNKYVEVMGLISAEALEKQATWNISLGKWTFVK